MKKVLAFVLGASLLLSLATNFLLFRVAQQQAEQLSRPLSTEWLLRLDINSITVLESGEVLTDRALGLIQKEVLMDIHRIQSNHDSLSPAQRDRYQASLDRLAKKFEENPELFALEYLHGSADSRERYLDAIGADDS
ncbi:hypothetical protein [Lentisalinibacter sediminis]|uniref:hypothetical protein n=1 Tax=Lentisalinibacter sediminis TaxID=2992237 RepID=UPI003866AA04